MQTDRTTKLLLFAIAAGLWTMILKPAFTPAPATAEAGLTKVQIVKVGNRDVSDTMGVPVVGAPSGSRPVSVSN